MTEFWDILDENGNATSRIHERGKPMRKGEYHLVVYVLKTTKVNSLFQKERQTNGFPDSGNAQAEMRFPEMTA